jgi:hypothetical protein
VDRAAHWESIYAKRPPEEVSWYEPTPAVSLRRVRQAVEDGAQSLIDIGGGASTLVEEALQMGLRRIFVLDVSERALEASQARLGSEANRVKWIVGDVTEADDLGQFGIWHDRAVFPFPHGAKGPGAIRSALRADGASRRSRDCRDVRARRSRDVQWSPGASLQRGRTS